VLTIRTMVKSGSADVVTGIELWLGIGLRLRLGLGCVLSGIVVVRHCAM